MNRNYPNFSYPGYLVACLAGLIFGRLLRSFEGDFGPASVFLLLALLGATGITYSRNKTRVLYFPGSGTKLIDVWIGGMVGEFSGVMQPTLVGALMTILGLTVGLELLLWRYASETSS